MTTGSVHWQPLRDELSQWSALGRTARLWLRDDDTVAITPALERLSALASAHGAPILIATIPARAEMRLGDYFAAHPLLEPAVHGYAHADHAQAGRKTQEFPIARGAEVIIDELQRGRARLSEIFGARLTSIYVPPWNRISREVAALLPGVGFTALSGFGTATLMPSGSALREINTHVDIIDWRGNRGGRDHAWLVRELVDQLVAARDGGRAHVGVLTHHLVHDETAWCFLDALLDETAHHSAVQWTRASDLVSAA